MDHSHPGHDSSFRYSLHYRMWHDDGIRYAAARIPYYRKQLEPFLPPPGPCSVLDIGCGMGFVLLTLREMGFTNLHGIDADAEQAQSCQRFALPVEHVSDTISFLQSHPEEFDIVLLIDVLEHLPVEEQICFMRAVYGSMRAGGRVIVQVPNAGSILASFHRYIDFTHNTSFTPVSLIFVLKNAGYERIQIPGQGPLQRPSLALWKRSARAALRKWLIRYFWRQVLIAEVGGRISGWARVDDLPVELDILAVAFKPSGQPED